MEKAQNHNQPAPRSKHKRNSLTNRGVSVVALGVVLVGGGAAVGVEALASNNANHTSQAFDKFDSEPQMSIVLDPGQGIDSLIEEVDPTAMNNPQEKADLENYLSQQTGPSKIPQAGQAYSVPILPGQPQTFHSGSGE